MEKQVGFLTPNNQRIMMRYDEILSYCDQLCCSLENMEEWEKFQKDYTYFSPAFDFVMTKLNYVFINPLLQQNTYLKSIKNRMFIISLDKAEVDYQEIVDAAIGKNAGGNYADLVVSSDKELNIKKWDQHELDNWLIDPNGYVMITKSDEKEGNHEITGNTVLNQLLLSDKNLCELDVEKDYSVIFLIKYFGFIRTTAIQYGGYLIGINHRLSPVTKAIMDYYSKVAFFEELPYESVSLPLDYPINITNNKKLK